MSHPEGVLEQFVARFQEAMGSMGRQVRQSVLRLAQSRYPGDPLPLEHLGAEANLAKALRDSRQSLRHDLVTARLVADDAVDDHLRSWRMSVLDR